jgi:hypothetical protein
MKERKKKVFSSKDKLRVRKSYYTFTREYPKYIEVEKTGRRITAAGLRKAAVYLAAFFVIASVSFFGVKLALDISYAPIPQEEEQTKENIFAEKILLELLLTDCLQSHMQMNTLQVHQSPQRAHYPQV